MTVDGDIGKSSTLPTSSTPRLLPIDLGKSQLQCNDAVMEVPMSDAEEEVPEWLPAIPPQTDDEVWAQIERRFDDLRDTLNQVELESEKQAIPQRHGVGTKDFGVLWEKPDVEGKVRSWLQIPFDPDRDEDQLHMKWKTALHLATKLEPKIKAQDLNVSFLAEWGAFTEYAATVEHEYLRKRPDLRRFKGGARQSKDQHKRWYAHAFVKLRHDGDTRLDTDQRVLELLNDILERGEYPDPAFPQNWFYEFRSSDGDFTRAFQAPELTLEHIGELAKQPSDDLPFRDLISSDP